MVVPTTHHWISSSGRSPSLIDGRWIKARRCCGVGGHTSWNKDLARPPAELKLDLHLEIINFHQRAAVRSSGSFGGHTSALQTLTIGPRQHPASLSRCGPCANQCFLPRIGWEESNQLSDLPVLPTNWRLCHIGPSKAPLVAEKGYYHGDYRPEDALAWYESCFKRSGLLTDLGESVDALNDWEVEP